jgi:hypothetical protein
MKADNLTRAQCRALKNKIEPMVGYCTGCGSGCRSEDSRQRIR